MADLANKKWDPTQPIQSIMWGNNRFHDRIMASNPNLFAVTGAKQTPAVMWIGCSDSRVSETSLLDLNPGEIFVHRNIGNLVNPGDRSLPAVLHYATDELKVNHIIVCGHIGCGAVHTALGTELTNVPAIDDWLIQLKFIAKDHAAMLDALPAAEKEPALVRLNVQRSIKTLLADTGVKAAMAANPNLQIHGMTYDVTLGRIGLFEAATMIEPAIPLDTSFVDPTYWYSLWSNTQGSTHVMGVNAYQSLDTRTLDTNSGEQKWKFVYNGDGTFSIKSQARGDGLALDVKPTKVFCYLNTADPAKNPGQRWRFKQGTRPGLINMVNESTGTTKKMDIDPGPERTPMLAEGNDWSQDWNFVKLARV